MTITPLMPVYPRSPVRPVRGEGVYLYGDKGEKYLDFASGIAVNALGHNHPHLTKAIQDQAATLIHVSNLYGSPQGEAFAQRLVDLTFADTAFLTNSGVEAVECAIKDKKHLIVEAGTGTGKTLAYLVPAILSGKRVIISTGTKNLQEQLYFKDIPFLESLLGPLKVCTMKGRANYVCKQKLYALAQTPLAATPAAMR